MAASMRGATLSVHSRAASTGCSRATSGRGLALREATKVLVDAGIGDVRPGPSGGMSVLSYVVPRQLLREGNAYV